MSVTHRLTSYVRSIVGYVVTIAPPDVKKIVFRCPWIKERMLLLCIWVRVRCISDVQILSYWKPHSANRKNIIADTFRPIMKRPPTYYLGEMVSKDYIDFVFLILWCVHFWNHLTHLGDGLRKVGPCDFDPLQFSQCSKRREFKRPDTGTVDHEKPFICFWK